MARYSLVESCCIVGVEAAVVFDTRRAWCSTDAVARTIGPVAVAFVGSEWASKR